MTDWPYVCNCGMTETQFTVVGCERTKCPMRGAPTKTKTLSELLDEQHVIGYREGWAAATCMSPTAVLKDMLRDFKPTPLTPLQQFWIGFKIPFQRMRDAWLVLIGSASI